MRYLFGIFALLFAAGAILNVINGVWDEAIAGICISAVLGSVGYFQYQQEKKANEFLIWLSQNKVLIESGEELDYGDKRISMNSEVTQFQFCISMLIVTFKFTTKYVFGGDFSRPVYAFVATMFSLVFGWWGIPFGPIYTIQSVYKNLMGGYQSRIEDIFSEIDKNVKNENA